MAFYFSRYNNDALCVYTIVTSQNDPILVRILFFDTEEGYDFLLIGEGDNPADWDSMLAKLTGKSKLRTLLSSKSQLWLTFTTDSSGTATGYEVEINVIANDLLDSMFRNRIKLGRIMVKCHLPNW